MLSAREFFAAAVSASRSPRSLTISNLFAS
jgi:hypothetical protein